MSNFNKKPNFEITFKSLKRNNLGNVFCLQKATGCGAVTQSCHLGSQSLFLGKWTMFKNRFLQQITVSLSFLLNVSLLCLITSSRVHQSAAEIMHEIKAARRFPLHEYATAPPIIGRRPVGTGFLQRAKQKEEESQHATTARTPASRAAERKTPDREETKLMVGSFFLPHVLIATMCISMNFRRRIHNVWHGAAPSRAAHWRSSSQLLIYN